MVDATPSIDLRPVSIYCLFSEKDGLIRYVGKTVRKPAERLSQHCSDAARGRESAALNWIRKLAASNMQPSIRVLEVVPPGSDWGARESYWIEIFRSEYILNIMPGGVGCRPGIRSTEETLKKRRETRAKTGTTSRMLSAWKKQTGRKMPEEVRLKLLGRKEPPEITQLRADKLRGRKLSPEHLAILKAWKPTDEIKAKISESSRGRVFTPEARANMKAAQACRTPEWNAKNASARTGAKRSDEARARMSAGRKGKRASDEGRKRQLAGTSTYWANPPSRARPPEPTKPCIVYALIDPKTNDVGFIGVTSQPIAPRVRQHIKLALDQSVTPVSVWIRKLQTDGIRPRYKVLERDVSPEHWEERDAFWKANQQEIASIPYHRRTVVHSAEHIAKRAASKRANTIARKAAVVDQALASVSAQPATITQGTLL